MIKWKFHSRHPLKQMILLVYLAILYFKRGYSQDYLVYQPYYINIALFFSFTYLCILILYCAHIYSVNQLFSKINTVAKACSQVCQILKVWLFQTTLTNWTTTIWTKLSLIPILITLWGTYLVRSNKENETEVSSKC